MFHVKTKQSKKKSLTEKIYTVSKCDTALLNKVIGQNTKVAQEKQEKNRKLKPQPALIFSTTPLTNNTYYVGLLD